MRFLSLFSGLEAASEAWLSLGWTCAAVAEIDAFPSALLAHHYLDVPNLGDVKKITEQQIADLGPLDLVVFGFPCQDLSVAGKRKGLIDESGDHTRSGLFFRAMQIVRWAERNNGCRLALAENVPGLFSSGGGADFATVLGEMAGAEFTIPKTKWKNTGLALGRDGLVEWAVLDAQWFGVPQRRRRVFIIRDTGDWGSRPPILFERESLQGNSPPSRETRQSLTYDVAPCIGASGRGFERTGDTRGADCVVAFGGNNTSGPIDVSTAVLAHESATGRMDFGSETFITHSLRADWFDASEDGTGRGTPLVPVAIQERACCENPNAGPDGIGVRTDGVAYSLEARSVPQAVAFRVRGEHSTAMTGNGIAHVADPVEVSRSLDSCGGYATNQGGNIVLQPLAFSCKDHGADAGDLAPTLRSMGHDGSHANAGGQVAVALMRESGQGYWMEDDKTGPLRAEGENRPSRPSSVVAIGWSGVTTPKTGIEVTPTLRADQGGEGSGVCHNMAVRRLTPKECERLQGFPDGYTQVPYRNKPAADGPRYKALGNSMAVPCMRWIGMQLEKVQKMDKGSHEKA